MLFSRPSITPNPEPGPSALNLRRICFIRALVLIMLTIALIIAKWQLQISLAYTQISLILAMTGILTLASLWRIRRPWPVAESELFAHLMIDLLMLSCLLYFAGGATNPFVSYYLIPLIIAATSLPQRYTWVIAALSITAYCSLLFFHQPLELLAPQHQHNNDASIFNTHLLGMLATFMLSVLLITYFVVRMAKTLRQQDQALSLARENTLRDEHILSIATMAAGTAHQLGTPLSTISVLANEVQRAHQANGNTVKQIDLLKEQIHNCKTTLQTLSSAAELSSSNINESHMAADEYIIALIDQWRSLRSEATPAFNILNDGNAPSIKISPSLDQAIHNLLNNAEDASPGNVSIKLDWDNKHIVLSIQDRGDGIAPEIAAQIGKPFFTTKAKGLGLGLFLSHAAIDRHQGSLKMYQQNGTLVELTLPTVRHPQ